MYELKFDFATTTYCQSKCRICPRTDVDTGGVVDWLTPTHVPLNTLTNRFDSLLHLVDQSKRIDIQLCGELGDPMMHPKIDDILTHIHNAEHINHVEVNTNGGLRNPNWYEMIGEKFGDNIEIVFGIDGIDHNTNWLYREGVDFSRAWNNMLSFRKANKNTTWQFIIFEWNWHQIKEAHSIANNEGLDMKWIINSSNFGRLTPINNIEVKRILNELS